jgi:hypothetical protein
MHVIGDCPDFVKGRSVLIYAANRAGVPACPLLRGALHRNAMQPVRRMARFLLFYRAHGLGKAATENETALSFQPDLQPTVRGCFQGARRGAAHRGLLR